MRHLTVALLLLALPASAQYVCRSRSNGVWIYTADLTRCTDDSMPGGGGSEEIKMLSVMCDMIVSGLPHCDPPATMTYTIAKPPFNVLVKFDGEFKDNGYRMWRWRSVQTGKVLYVTPRIFLLGAR